MTDEEREDEVGPSVVLGLVGAVVVLLLLGAGIWGVGKIVSKVREGDEGGGEEDIMWEETVSEDNEEEGEVAEDNEEENEDAAIQEGEGEIEGEEEEEDNAVAEQKVDESVEVDWKATDYQSDDIKGDTYTVVWGDTLWEIAEARYGSGFEWEVILEANSDTIGYLPDGSQALIVPGQVLNL